MFVTGSILKIKPKGTLNAESEKFKATKIQEKILYFL